MDELDSEYRSPFAAFVINLILPGFIFWQFGHRVLGGTIMVIALLLFPLGDEYGEVWGAGIVFACAGPVTGSIAFFVYAREHMQRR